MGALFNLGKAIVKEAGQGYMRARQERQQQQAQQPQYQQPGASSQQQYQQQYYSPPEQTQSRAQPSSSAYQQPQPQSQPQQWSSSQPPRSNTPPPPARHPCGITPITECLEDSPALEMDWFIHPSAPNYLICTKCYVDHIWNTQYRSSFQHVHLSREPHRRCHFGRRRMKDVLWPAAVSSSNLNSVVAFMQQRQNIAHCPGQNTMSGTWYTSPSIPNTTFCPACYEDLLMSCSFGANFRPMTGEGFCDGNIIYVKRMFESYAPTNNWAEFARQVQARIQFPQCDKNAQVPVGSRSWYVATRGPQGMEICGACFCDFFYNTPDEQYWKPTTPSGQHAWCLMSSTNVVLAAERSTEKKNFEIFWKAMEQGDKQPYCSPMGTSGATWYTLPNKPKGFRVCGACISTTIYALGGTSWFIPKSTSLFGSDSNLCAFNSAHPNFAGNLITYYECVIRGTWKPLGDFAAATANIAKPPPPSIPNISIASSYQSPSYSSPSYGQSSGPNFADLQQRKLELQRREMAMNKAHWESKAMLNHAHTEALIANQTKFMGDVQGSNGYVVGNPSRGWYANEMSYKGVLDLERANQMTADALAHGSKIRY